MSKPIIAIDIDDVLADSATGFVEFSNKRWGTNLKPDDYDEHWTLLWGVDQEEAEERAVEVHNSKMTTNFLHKEEALPVLKKLAKKYELVITTSRRRQLESETIAWLEKHYNGIFLDIHFAGIWDTKNVGRHTQTKLDLCLEVGAQYLIDDQPKHCIAVAGVGIQALLFGNYGWNKNIVLPGGVTRAKNWKDVEEYFDAQ